MKRQFKKIAVAAGLLVGILSPFNDVKVSAMELFQLNRRTDFLVTRIDHRNNEISFVYENTTRIPVFATVYYGDATDEMILEAALNPDRGYAPDYSMEIAYYREGWSIWQGFEANKEYTVHSTNYFGWNDGGNLYYLAGYKESEDGELKIEMGRAKYNRCLNAEAYKLNETSICRVEIWDDGKIHYQPYDGWNRLVVGDEEENAGSITKENIKTVTVFMPDVQYVEKEVKVPVEVEKIVEVPVEVEKIVEVPVEVEKIVEVPVEVEKIVEVPVEVPVEVEKIVEVPVEVEKIVEVPVEVPVEVEKIVEVPIYQTEIKTVDRLIEVPIEKEVVKEVEKIVEVPVEKEVIKEIEKKVEVPVEKEVVKEVTKEVPVEVKTVEKVAVNVPVEKPITNIREITKEVPVTTEKVNTVEVVKEVPVYQTKVEQVDSDIDVPSLGGCNEEGEWINRILAFITGVILASVGWIAVIMLKKRSENNN